MFFMVMDLADSPEEQRKIEKLYEKYQRLMYTVAYNILHHHENTEDAVFASWEKIIKHLDKISEIDCKETKSFIVIIVERTAIDFYRKKQKQWDKEDLFDEYDSSPFFATKDHALESVELNAVFRSLPKQYSEILILYYVNGMTQGEIADLLGMKENTVASRLHRAKKILEKELGNG